MITPLIFCIITSDFLFVFSDGANDDKYEYLSEFKSIKNSYHQFLR